MTHESKRLFVIDGMSLLFRSFYAMGTRLTSPDGTPIGAVYGFIKIMFKIFKEQKPTHFVVCWDLKDKTFRHEVFEAYKGNRGEPPPEIIPQIHMIRHILEVMKCPSLSLSGFEADDIAGSIAKYFEHYGEVYLVTSDKDYMQLITDKVFLFSLKKGDEYAIIDREKVFDYFGVYPEQVIEILALTGDAVDNIPGVKGIGEKTAAKLISEFGSIENLYENLDKVTNLRARNSLEANKEDAVLSKYLVTLKTDIPLNISEKNLRFVFDQLKENTEFLKILQELKMQTMIKTIYGTTSPDISKQDVMENAVEVLPIKKNSLWGERNYILVKTEKELEEIFAKIAALSEKDILALDTETTGLDVIEDKPIGVSLCFEKETAYYIPAHEVHLKYGSLLGSDSLPEYSVETVWSGLKKSLQSCQALIVAHNLKFDMHMLFNMGIDLFSHTFACTMVAAWVCDLDNDVGFSLDALTLRHYKLEKIPTSALIGKETKRTSMLEVPLHELSQYACEDAEATFKLWSIFSKKIQNNEEFNHLFFKIEMPVLKVLFEMERAGVHIDVPYLKDLAHNLEKNIINLEKKIFEFCSFEFKISSPKQLGDVLFERLKIHEQLGFKGKLAKTTQGYKTDASVLEQFSGHPFVTLITQYRELNKLLSTYVLALPKLIKPSTNRVHTHFNQIGTVTGRLSSSDPNLQNVPIRTELGKKVRTAFTISSPNNLIVSADYSQIELRVLAHLSKDKNMCEAFLSGKDFHSQTAAQILGKDQSEVDSEERSQAKAINFGIIYGMGAGRLARDQKIPIEQARKFIEKYFQNFPSVKNYLDSQRLLAHEKGMVKTLHGRVRLVDLTSKNVMEVKFAENAAINTPIQGTAAEVMKIGMIAVSTALKKEQLKSKIILQVHDELVLEVPKNELQEVTKILKEKLENVVKFSVPMSVQIGSGSNWLET